MAQWEVEYTDEFDEWWNGLDESAQASIDAHVGLLEEHGPNLGYPYSSDIKDSKHGNMREVAREIERQAVSGLLRLRSAAQRNSTHWWRQDRAEAVLPADDPNCRSAL
jgi:hypothetical protein